MSSNKLCGSSDILVTSCSIDDICKHTFDLSETVTVCPNLAHISVNISGINLLGHGSYSQYIAGMSISIMSISI